MRAVLLGLVAALGFGSFGTLTRMGLQGVNSSTGTAISLVASLIMTAILALVFDPSAFLTLPLVALFWLFLLGVVQYPVGRLLNFTSVDIIGAARATPLVATSPMFAAVLAIIFIGERPNWMIVLGTIIIILGLILIVREQSSGAT